MVVLAFGDVFAIFLVLFDAGGEKIFDLTIDRAEIIFCPGCEFLVELVGNPEGDLFLLSQG